MKTLLFIAVFALNTFSLSAQSPVCIIGDCMSNHGKIVFPDGSSYEGQFRQGKMHGLGIFLASNKSKYHGTWSANQRHGEGRQLFANGDTYEGDFVNNRMQGKGVMNFANGHQYDGDWVNDRPEGMGIYTFDGREKYVGEFVNGKFSGQGVYYYENGSYYEGRWVENDRDGAGTMVLASGKTVTGSWVANEYQGDPNDLHEIIEVDLSGMTAEVLNDNEEDDTKTTNVVKPFESTVKIHAVLVGVSQYTATTQLNYTDDDAYQMYAFLKSPEGGAVEDENITVLIDETATRARILAAMRDVFSKADEDDVILFYFSGHGVKGAFLPIDFTGDWSVTLPHDEITDILHKSKAKHKVVIADACYAGSFALTPKSPYQANLQTFYDAFEQSAGGLALFLSSRSNEISLEDADLRSGLYSHYIREGLKGAADTNGDNVITVTELNIHVTKRLQPFNQAQNPMLIGDHDPNMPIAMVRS